MNIDMKKESFWALSVLAIFLLIILFIEDYNINSIIIATAIFTINWTVISFFIKKFGDKNSLQKELQWFFGLLVLFLGFLLVLGVKISYDYAIAMSAFTFIWIIRSFFIKRFGGITKFEDVN